jgi:glycine betaine/proline transport system substrate-binding protein
MKGRRLVVVVAVVGILLAVTIPAFAGNITKEEAPASVKGKTCGTINLAVNNWVGYEADAFVVGEVAKKRLGCLVNYVYIDEQISWQGFASGQVDAVLENWGHQELIDLYVKKLKVAQDAGSIGITGVIGWYVPPWMKKKYPDITNWKSLNKYASLFKTTESGGKGQLLDGDPGFVSYVVALV